MSVKRLTAEERATYLLGLAVERQFENAPRDPDTRKEIEAVCRWINHWLTPDEVLYITTRTGFLIDEGLADEHFGPEGPSCPARTRKPDEPDDIPF